jgi:AcrR family transcriptional regulator
VVDTAIAMFLADGFERVSCAEVAARAEVSKPTLFEYFPTKEDLVLPRITDHEEEAAEVVRRRPAGEPALARAAPALPRRSRRTWSDHRPQQRAGGIGALAG